ncbi:MAG: ATP-dependent Clp protease ATP-binding subunit ClpB, partial [Solirubrobacteraceae bacterium]|nr:ATP-dependent Clp protease ATP-binding subunit ClpB [Solirubrobacteraceae bacterium]
MDINRLTQKSQQAVHDAQTKAMRFGHTEVDVEHLLLALLDQADGLIPRLLERAGTDVDAVRADLQKALESRPRVSGSGATGDVRVSRGLAMLLEDAEKEAARLKDEYISVEHLVLAMLRSRTTAGKILKDRGLSADRFLEVLTEVRGAQRVTSATPETAYEALEKYGRDLVAEARSGKLDPVIGR